jgi:hypothetical protein
MRRFRTLLAGAAAAGLALTLVPSPSSAADAAVIVFTAGATVGQKVYAPGLGPATPENTFSFSTNNTGLGGQKACLGVTQNGVDTGCALGATGTFGAGLGGFGGYCGYSSGEGTSSGTVAGVSLSGVTVEWPQSAGTVLPLVYRLGGTPIGTGAVQTTGAAPGTCGVGDGTSSFAVTGFTVLATV